MALAGDLRFISKLTSLSARELGHSRTYGICNSWLLNGFKLLVPAFGSLAPFKSSVVYCATLILVLYPSLSATNTFNLFDGRQCFYLAKIESAYRQAVFTYGVPDKRLLNTWFPWLNRN